MVRGKEPANAPDREGARTYIYVYKNVTNKPSISLAGGSLG